MQEDVKMWFWRLFICPWRWCGGTIDHDGISVCWTCARCKKVIR